ncbi:MAG: EAL domain-containing protein [Betaproteobacteria bacterium]|nr:EAL domain-containing protein [Betaproteobacteria bacterium]
MSRLNTPSRITALLALPVVIMLLWAIWNEFWQFQIAKHDAQARAQSEGLQYANRIANRLDLQFSALQFIGTALLQSDRASNQPSVKTIQILRLYLALHPGLYAFNIQSPDGNRIVWSTHRQSARPINPARVFTPLARNSQFLLGQSQYAQRVQSRVIPMRYRVTDRSGRVQFFVGTPYRVDRLLEYFDSAPWRFQVIDTRDHRVVGIWQRSQAGRTTTLSKPAATEAEFGPDIAVPGYPFAIKAGWPPALVTQAWLKGAWPRWLLEVLAVTLLALAAWWMRRLLRQQQADRSRLRAAAYSDPLTGLPNRLALQQRLPLAQAQARRNGTLLAVGFMDLDDFKPINDTWGHAAGDALLRSVAERLRSCMRETDLVARLGGDEFVLVFEGLTRSDDLTAALQRIHAAVEQPFTLPGGHRAQVGISLGLTLYPDDDSDADLLLRHADAALYASKLHKADRPRWWRLWGQDGQDSDDTRMERNPLRIDPYGPAAGGLLESAQEHFAAAADSFVGRFYAAAAQETESAAILSRLTPAEFSRLKARQAEHLRSLLSADLTEDDQRQRAARVGEIHALVGMRSAAVVKSFGMYLQRLSQIVGSLHARVSDRQDLAHILIGRLQVELEAQVESIQQTHDQFPQWIFRLEQRFPEWGHWIDFVREMLDEVIKLPGICAAVFYKPDAQGHFVYEFNSGRFGDYMRSLVRHGVPSLVLNRHSPYGQSPHPRAWRSERIETNPSYSSDPRMAPWKEAAHAVGIRSSVAIPIKDGRDHMVGVIGLYGLYPGQFESAAMQAFSDSLAQVCRRFLQRSQSSRLSPPLPAQERSHWRERLFGGGLEMFMQPVVNLHTGKPFKVEALARLRLGDGKLITPGQFLPTFGSGELSHLFVLGLDQALSQVTRWDALGLSLEMSINLPPEVLLDAGCPRWIDDALQKHRIAPKRLHLEILESAEFDDDKRRDAAVQMLTDLGVRLVMDDLGSGYSSLLRLRALPFHAFKIDQGLVREAHKDPRRIIGFIGALVRLGKGLGLMVAVEGLETPDLIEAAAVLGADGGQGYALAKPMPASDLPDWVRHFRLSMDHSNPQTLLGTVAADWLREQTVLFPQSRSGTGAVVTAPVNCQNAPTPDSIE